MGYYTKYSISIKAGPTDCEECPTCHQQLEISPVTIAEGDLDVFQVRGGQTISQITEDTTKWYDWHEDLKTFSKRHPMVLVVCYGEGEENGDQWKAYFLNGKSVVNQAVISFPEFTMEELL